MELDIIYRLTLLAGFLTAGFLALLIALAVVALRCWYRSTMWDLERMIDELDTGEEGTDHGSKDH